MKNRQHDVYGFKTGVANRFRGFSLVEVLVALFVLSIGLLGLAALQTVGLKYNRQSYQRTQAIFQAYDIIDRIRANSLGKTAGCYSAVLAGATATTGGCTATYKDCKTSACNANELANYDINKWNSANALLLAGGQGAISTSGTSRRTITLTWVEDDLPGTFVLEVDL